MTERRAAELRRDARTLAIGPSALTWDGDDLLIRIDEWTAPVPPVPTAPSRVLGTVRVTPGALNREAYALDVAGRHVWRPIAPRAHVEVRMREPDLSWRGEGYLDTNAGTEPPEHAFATWHWSRAHLQRDSVVLYDLERADGSDLTLALRFDAQGRAEALEPPPPMRLPDTSCWRMPRRSRADDGAGIRIRRTWEDTPFYARTAIDTQLFGEAATGVHESLSLTRLRSPLVRSLLAFRMPRALR